MNPTALDIFAARRRIRDQVHATPLRDSVWLSSRGAVALKLESVQRTGSFKIRGALNALLCERTRAAPGPAPQIVTASAGNHGRAVAMAGRRLGLRTIVFAPRDAPRAKLTAIAREGSDLRLTDSYDAAESAARALAAESGARFVSPYNHPDVIAGAGTVALEILEALPDAATLVVPVGGGGLVAGVALAAKTIAPRTRVIGVEAAASHAMLASVRAGRIVPIEPRLTLADGLAGNLESGAITFDLVRRYVDDLVTVTEDELAEAMAGLLIEERLVVEGAGAAAVAALVAAKLPATAMTVALVTGSNVDVDVMMKALRSGRQRHDQRQRRQDGERNQHDLPDAG